MIGTKSRAEDSYSVLSSAAPESPALFSSSLSTRWHQCLEEKMLFSNAAVQIWLGVSGRIL